MKNRTVLTRVGNQGQEIYAFEFDSEAPVSKGEVSITGNLLDTSIDCFLAMQTGRLAEGIRNVTWQQGKLRIDVAAFSYQAPYVLKIGSETFSAAQAASTKTLWADDFRPVEENGIRYRLYEPKGAGPRPMILFLHGGGEGGLDNWKQLVGCFGPTFLAEKYPDCYVMAPQAINPEPTKEQLEAFKRQTFYNSWNMTGWDRETLSRICDIIRGMIAQGKVNGRRVYVTGLSMGGGGTLRAMNVGSDLFAAAVPVCPTMTPETFNILRGLTHSKIWVAASYIDHTLYRHKYLVDAVFALRDAGNNDAHLTLFSPEDLAKYGIGIIPDMPLEARFGWNHTCWIPTYHDEDGIMSWMMNQVRD